MCIRDRTEADVSKFLKQLHAQVLEKMLEGEMDAHMGYEKNSVSGHNSGNSRKGSYPKKDVYKRQLQYLSLIFIQIHNSLLLSSA